MTFFSSIIMIFAVACPDPEKTGEEFIAPFLYLSMDEDDNATVVATPKNLAADAGHNVVTLTWDSVSDADSYSIYRGTATGFTADDDSLLAENLTDADYSDTSVSKGVDYYYVVKATIGNATGSASSEAEARPWGDLDQQDSKVTADLHNVISGNGALWIAGDNGTILTSENGTQWTSRTSGTTKNLFGIAYGTDSYDGNDYYLAVGSNGASTKSTDGVSWTANEPASADDWFGVAVAVGEFVVAGGTIGDDAAAYRFKLSTFEISGHKETLYFHTVLDINYGNSWFVAVGEGASFLYCESSCESDINWTYKEGFQGDTIDYHDIVYGDSKWVVVASGGNVRMSTDNMFSATELTTDTVNDLMGVIYDGVQFVAVGDNGSVVRSVDGTTWDLMETGVDTDDFEDIVYDSTNEQYVIVGSGGIIYTHPRY